jgi:hypothetical protein
MSKDGELVKVFFELEVEDDWPPVAVESVWARSTGLPHQYVIENTPFFTTSATLGDTVIAVHRSVPDPADADKLWFRERVKWGGYALIRLIIRRKEAEGEIVDSLESAGCVCEAAPRFALVAVSVPPEVDQAAVQHYVHQREEAGDVHVEEPILRD